MKSSKISSLHKKYFFFDIDGTLAPGVDKVVPSNTLHALDELRSRGHYVAIATGRLQVDAWDFAQSIGVDTLVSDGGNGITIDGRILQLHGLPLLLCRAFLKQLSKDGFMWAVSSLNELIRYSPQAYFTEAVGESYFRTEVMTEEDIFQLPTIYKIFIHTPNRSVDDIVFGPLPHVGYGSSMTLIEPCHKGEGIRRVMAHLGEPCSKVVVFGDGTNDVGMFLPEWFSVAMGNARKSLKDVADFITKDSDADGIGHACRRFGWIN